MKFFYVDWAPGRIGVANQHGILIEAQPSRFTDECQKGELEAVSLAVPLARDLTFPSVILTDSLSAVKLISGNGQPHPRAERPEVQVRVALRIRRQLKRSGVVVAWVPRQSNLAHQPLEEAAIQ